MANLFWVGGSNPYDGVTNRLATTSGGAATVTAIAAGDTVTFDTNSGAAAVTTSAAISCTSMTFASGFTGSLTMSNTLTISGALTHTAGTLNTNGQTCTWASYSSNNTNTRALTLGASSITVTATGGSWTINSTGMTLSAGTSTISFTGSSPVVALGSGLTYYNISASPTTNFQTDNSFTCNNFTYNGAATQANYWLVNSGTPTINGALLLSGNSAVNRIVVTSNAVGTTRTIALGGSATMKTAGTANVDFMDITMTGGAAGERDLSATISGDRQGNTGITFTTPATQTRDSTSGQSWGTAARWTSRVPLPQDDVVLNASSGSISSTDVLCLGKTIDMTSYAGTITQSTNSARYTIFGSINLGGVTWGTAPGVFGVSFYGRGSHTITSNGKTFFPSASNSSHEILAPGGTYTLADAFTQSVPINTSTLFAVLAGSFVTNNYSMTVGRFFANGSLTRSVTLGSSTISLLNDSGSQVILLTTTGLTWSGASSSWTLTNKSSNANNRSLDLVGFTIGTFTYNVANSPGGLTVSSSCTITNFNMGTGRLLTLTAGIVLTSTNYTLTGTNNGYIYAPGDNYMASAPDSAALSITGDMDFRQRMSFDSITPSGSMRIAGKYNATGNQKTWRWYITSSGTLTLDMSTTGADNLTVTSSTSLASAGLSANTNYWMRFTREKSTGNVKFYYAADSASMPSSWTQIGTTQTATTSALFDSTAALTIGGESSVTNPMPGRYYWSQLRNNILDDGTGIQFDAVFSSKTVGNDTFTESSSNAATVTMNGLSVYGDGRLQIVSATGGSKAYISKPSGGPITGIDYLKIQDIHAYEALNFYVGANSTLVSNTSGIYTSATTYTHTQSAANYTASSSTSLAATFPVATTSGNLLVAFVNSGGSTGGSETMTGWTLAKASSTGLIYYKISDGTETSVTYSQTTSRVITIGIIEYSGFSGTPTLDVTDSNSSSSSITSLSTTATTGPTNTAQPALAFAFAGGSSNLAQFVSATNSYIPDYTTGNFGNGNYIHTVVKELTALAANDTTITWTTSRANVYTGLVVFKNVSTGNSKYFMLMGVG